MRPASRLGTRTWLLVPAAVLVASGLAAGCSSRPAYIQGDAVPGHGGSVAKRNQEGAPQMSKWNFVAMGQVGLTGWTRVVAQPVARTVARKTGRPEAQILSLIGAGFLAIALIDFLREVDAVIAAGRTRPSAGP
jgi:hypothetical protein